MNIPRSGFVGLAIGCERERSDVRANMKTEHFFMSSFLSIGSIVHNDDFLQTNVSGRSAREQFDFPFLQNE
jgi:hypothetical protein